MSGGVFGDVRHIMERLLILQDAGTNFLCLEDFHQQALYKFNVSPMTATGVMAEVTRNLPSKAKL